MSILNCLLKIMWNQTWETKPIGSWGKSYKTCTLKKLSSFIILLPEEFPLHYSLRENVAWEGALHGFWSLGDRSTIDDQV